MKFLFLCLAAVASAEYTENLFKDWTAEHGKVYKTNAEAIKRYNIFKKNVAWINKRNTELEHMQVGLNQFADLEQDEFEAMYLTPLDEAMYKEYIDNYTTPQDPNNIPINGKCATAVRNQGQCGSCWAFSAAGALEALLCLPSEDGSDAYGHVSTQNFVDCVDSGCNGGWPRNALKFATSNGACSEGDYPYTARDGSCKKCKNPIKKEKGQHSCQDSGGGITSALSGNFVSICIDAGGLDFRFYKSGTFMPGVNCNHHSVNHAVLAVTANANGNYHVKNSWGSSWGSGGYFDMPAGVNCLGVNNNPSVYPY